MLRVPAIDDDTQPTVAVRYMHPGDQKIFDNRPWLTFAAGFESCLPVVCARLYLQPDPHDQKAQPVSIWMPLECLHGLTDGDTVAWQSLDRPLKLCPTLATDSVKAFQQALLRASANFAGCHIPASGFDKTVHSQAELIWKAHVEYALSTGQSPVNIRGFLHPGKTFLSHAAGAGQIVDFSTSITAAYEGRWIQHSSVAVVDIVCGPGDRMITVWSGGRSPPQVRHTVKDGPYWVAEGTSYVHNNFRFILADQDTLLASIALTPSDDPKNGSVADTVFVYKKQKL